MDFNYSLYLILELISHIESNALQRPLFPIQLQGYKILDYCIFHIAFTIIIVAEGIGNYQHVFQIKESENHKLSLATIASATSHTDDLIAINGDENPQQLYFTNRKGWSITTNQIFDPVFTTSLKEKGCKFIFINKATAKNHLPSVVENVQYEDENFLIIGL